MKKFFKWLFTEALDPSCTTRRYKVITGNNYFGGSFENFWLLKNAQRYKNKIKPTGASYVLLEDDLTGKRISSEFGEWWEASNRLNNNII